MSFKTVATLEIQAKELNKNPQICKLRPKTCLELKINSKLEMMPSLITSKSRMKLCSMLEGNLSARSHKDFRFSSKFKTTVKRLSMVEINKLKLSRRSI